MLEVNHTPRTISPHYLTTQNLSDSLVKRMEKKSPSSPTIPVCRSSNLFHPITQCHPEPSAAFEELQFCTEICSFSTLKAVDVRTMIWQDDVYAVLLSKEKTTHCKHSLWDEVLPITYLSAFQRALAEWLAPRNAVLQQEPSSLPPSFESMTYLTKFLHK